MTSVADVVMARFTDLFSCQGHVLEPVPCLLQRCYGLLAWQVTVGRVA
jgi:hypothetical protein